MLNEKIPLVGDYTKAETLDYFEDAERPAYILTSKMACTERDAKCVLIMEIDYEKFVDDLSGMLKSCDIDYENIDYNNPPTEEQIECARELMENLGMNIP